MTGQNEPREAELWDERYRAAGRLWSGRPNPQLVAEVAGLPPGRALDAGCGEGADAIWLAQRGWRVVGADISGVALQRAAQHASEAGGGVAARIEWRHVDLLEQAPERDAFDLVSAHFMQLPPDAMARLFTTLAAAVRPGGTLLVVSHHPSDLTTGVRRPSQPELLYAAEDVAALLDSSWEVVVADTRPRPAVTPEGTEATVHDAVLRAVRRRAPQP